MKYITPEFEIVVFEANDIITVSGLAVMESDNNVQAPDEWWT